MSDRDALARALAGPMQDHETSGIHGPLTCGLACGYSLADRLLAAGVTLAPDTDRLRAVEAAARSAVDAEDIFVQTYSSADGKVADVAMNALRAALAATPELTPAPPALDAAYRERNAVVAALIRVGGYPAQVTMAPDTEGWWIVYAETPAGQVSWHISPDDMDLFSEWPVAFGSRPSPWDGHSTEEKYRRVARLATTTKPQATKPPNSDQYDVVIPATDHASEYGRLLAERDRLIGQGVDPTDLELPDRP